MNALFVAPLPFVEASGSSATLGETSVANLNDDTPNMAWRGSTTGVVVIDLGTDPVAFDTFALIGSNLRASDRVRIQTGSTTATSDGYDTGLVVAYSGEKPRTLSTKTIIHLPTTLAHRFVRVTVNAAGHPAGFVQFQRLVVGRAVKTIGVRFGAKMSFKDRSVITTGEGYEDIARGDRRLSWDIETTMISDRDWRTRWAPLLLDVGSSSGLLFVRDSHSPDTWQTDAVYGRITNEASGQANAYDWWVFAGTIVSFAP